MDVPEDVMREIMAAAGAEGKSVSAFMLDAATAAAEHWSEPLPGQE